MSGPNHISDAKHGMVGSSRCLRKLLDQAERIAPTDADVLVQAESGTGKELLARYIHRISGRRTQPFIALNCAAFPETLLESELFGHTRGAFTGAAEAKPGKFEIANGGTLLLDEIGEMPLSLQPKLLRALQEREFERLGDTRSVRVDIRVIATTNQPLPELVANGKFRPDLYYRLNVIPLTLPPLRSRAEDIPELVTYFASKHQGGRETLPRFSKEFLLRLQARSWPGNIRELENVIRRALTLFPDDVIGEEALTGIETDWQESSTLLHAGLSLREAEKRLLELTLQATLGNRSQAAELLGISIRTVRNKIRDYELPRRYA